MMLKIYAAVFGLLLIGGIVAYSLGTAWSGVSTVMGAIDPSLASNQAADFLDAAWIWMPLAVIIAAFVYEVVNTQREAQYGP